MTGELVENIRTANREFREFIDQAAQRSAKGVESRWVVRRLQGITLRLAQISEYLAASRPIMPAADAADDVRKYTENLKALRAVLETLQFSLLAEKARLETARANLRAACAWAMSLHNISAEP